MQHSAKYIIHADVRTSGVVERSDVVGAIFGQTEGLLGDDMDLRDLQDSSKVGRIDVDIDSEGGRSFGTIKIASGLDRVETAVLAAALETIDRVGPCRAACTISKIEDARAAKRRGIVDRATELLARFDDEALTSDRLVTEVRERVRESDITAYREMPAGPRVADSDAIIVVEGRADVRKLVSYGIKNVIAVEGTDIPDEIAQLTTERTTTALLDGDRGGDLILRELTQVGEVDYVAFAPSGKSVEDLDRAAVIDALRKKLPYDQVNETHTPREAFAPTDGGTLESMPESTETPHTPDENHDETAQETATLSQRLAGQSAEPDDHTETVPEKPASVDESTTIEADTADTDGQATPETPPTLADHVRAVTDAGVARLLDSSLEVLAEIPAEDVFDHLTETETVPQSVVVDATVGQKLLDIAAQRGISRIIATEIGEIVKQPTSVRLHTTDEL